MPQDNRTRLNKFLALNLGVSRRQADDLISQNRVIVNQQIARLGDKVGLDDLVICDGQPVDGQLNYIYLVINKPVGYVCSRRQQGSSPTIYSLLPKKYHHLKTVGRLDKDSSGIILLTNNGDLSHQMTHPSFKKLKLYEVKLDKDLAPIHQQMINDFGINLDDGLSHLQLSKLSENSRQSWQVAMQEGRNRQIRRTFQALGYKVAELHRQQFGNLKLEGLNPGEWRLINIT